MHFRSRALLLLGLVACSALPVIVRADTPLAAPAAPDGFVSSLSDGDRKAAGLDKLSAEELSELDYQVSKEASLARAGNVRGFAGTFTGRRNPAERVAAGLQRLNDTETAKLNDLVAARIARGPDATLGVTRLKKEVVQKADAGLQVHGEVSFTYGWQKGGGDFKGGSVFVTAHDPDTNFSIGVGYAQYEGSGWWGYPGYYSGYYPGYYSAAYPRFMGATAGPAGCVVHP